MSRGRRGKFVVVALGLVAWGLAPYWTPPAAGSSLQCTAQPSEAGDWPMSGHDLSGSRAQPDETTISPNPLSPNNASSLRPVWSFYTGHQSGGNALNIADINSTPVEAGGCVYFGTAFSSNDPHDPGYPNLFALDANTGQVAWSLHLDVPDPGVGGDIVGSPAVVGSRLYVLVNERGDGNSSGPYAVAINRHSGAIIWRGQPFVTDAVCSKKPSPLPIFPENQSCAGVYTNASPVVADGVLIAGFSAWEGEPDGHGGFALIDAATGRLLAKPTYTIPPSAWVAPDGYGCDGNPITQLPVVPPDPQQHCGGGGIWTTPVVDPASGYAYMGTGNPYSKKSEYKTTNAIIKVDIDLSRPTFGQIVAYYKGNIDQSAEPLHTATENTTCQVLPDDRAVLQQVLQTLGLSGKSQVQDLQGGLSDSHGCLQFDLDFGAGANLFRDDAGNLIVGDLQKSGVYHAVKADQIDPKTGQMTVAWTSTLGPSCNLCNAASTALDPSGDSIYAAVAPGSLTSITTGTNGILQGPGALRWYTPFGDVVHYEGVSVANGVAYSIETNGFLDAVDTRTGLPLLHRFLPADGGEFFPFGSAGPAIARNTVFVPSGSHLIAYRPA